MEKIEQEIIDENELQRSTRDIEIVTEDEILDSTGDVENKKEEASEEVEEIENEIYQREKEGERVLKGSEDEDDEILTNEPRNLFHSAADGLNGIPYSPIPSNHSSFSTFQESSELSFKQIFAEIEALKKHVQLDTFKISGLESQLSSLQAETQALRRKNVRFLIYFPQLSPANSSPFN